MDLNFKEKLNAFYNDFGNYKTMVLSTSLNDKVTSRMMSVILIDGKIYFQTDKSFRKYNQLINNPNVALCIDNVQIEGICREIGKPSENEAFCQLYKKYYKSSYDMYSSLDNEVLFEISPVYIQKWIYENERPFIESFDCVSKNYRKELYVIGE